MRYFLLLLKQSRILLLFLVLEGIALTWVIQTKSFARAQYRSASTELNGKLSTWNQEWASYLNLKMENDFLAEENRKLRQQLNSSLLIQHYGADTIGDSTLQQRYIYSTGKVIHSSHLKANNFLIVDKGRRSGIKRNMGVIGPQGVVGVVASVSSNFCRVIPLINNSLTLSASLQKEAYFGPLKWPGKSYRLSEVSDIPRYAEVQEGDTLLTDGRSRYFPANIPIGTVLSKELQADQNFFRLQIELATDFSKLKEVYLVKDLFMAEVDSLLNDAQP